MEHTIPEGLGAYLFHGGGASDAARAFAVRLTNGVVEDVIYPTNELYGITDRKTDRLSVEAIREMIQSDAYTAPYAAPRKAIVFIDADTLSEGVQNTLLKVLEEPPPHTVFILAANNRRSLLPTVLSRVYDVHCANGAHHTNGAAEMAVESPALTDVRALLVRLLDGQRGAVYELSQRMGRGRQDNPVTDALFFDMLFDLIAQKRCDGAYETYAEAYDVASRAQRMILGNANPYIAYTELCLDLCGLFRI